MSDLTDRLRRHIEQMSPHQREREGGRLLIEALREIQAVRAEIRLMECAADLYIGGSDG